MAWTGKSGWFGKRFSGSKILGSKPKPSAMRRRQRLATRPAESLEARLLLSGTGSPELLDTNVAVEITGVPEIPFSAVPGISVASAGDINGDGFDDLILGVGYASVDGVYGVGQSFVVFGTDQAISESIDLASLDGNNGFKINGFESITFTGRNVSTAGDFNGDGFDDVILAAAGNGGIGGAFILFGRAEFEATVELSDFDRSQGFRIGGGADYDGFDVSGAGDVNGDGLDDVVLLDPQVDVVEVDGRSDIARAGAYVVFGRDDLGTGELAPQLMTPADGFRIAGPSGFDLAQRVAGIGDVNNDGLADVLLESQRRVDEGFIDLGIVVFGQTSFPEPVQIDELNGSNGFRIAGGAGTQNLRTTEFAGDFDGDGIDDILLADRALTPSSGIGGGVIIYGSSDPFPEVVRATELTAETGLIIKGTRDGDVVSPLGDFDGDGLADVAVSSSIVFGQDSHFEIFDLSDESFSEDMELVQPLYEDQTISFDAATPIGDFNGDGFDDAIIGERFNRGVVGPLHLVFGRGPDDEFRNETFGDSYGQRYEFAPGDLAAQKNVYHGRQGNDTLVGNIGPDALLGGQGDDVLEVEDLLFDRVAGGPGTDTFRLIVDDSTIDLTTIADSRLVDIEVIDLTGFGDNTLVLTQLEVLNLSSTSNSLTVLRDGSDIVEMGDGWELVDRGTDLWQSLEVYEQGEARVTLQGSLPEIDITQSETGGFQILGPEGSLR